MINNTFVIADGPLFETREDAIKADGEIFHHVKGGGIYRRIGSGLYAGDACAETLDRVSMSIYEHLWPHKHSIFIRPDSEFEEIVTTKDETGLRTSHPRFNRI